MSWRVLNRDAELLDLTAWNKGTWGKPEEGKTMFPWLLIRNGLAFTRLEMRAGRGNWNSCAFCQTIPGRPSLLTPQRLKLWMFPYLENPLAEAKFDAFAEYWVEFSEPQGPRGFTQAEVMVMLRFANGPEDPAPAEESYFVDGTWNPWYYVGYRVPDAPFFEWSEHMLDLNKLLFDKLKAEFQCDLGKGWVRDLNVGVEGYAADGAMDVAWHQIRHMVKV